MIFQKYISLKTCHKEHFTRDIEKVLSPYLVKRQFKAGYILWDEGETGGRMIFIISGKVKISRQIANGKQATIYIFGPGDTFGFMPFIDGSPYPASAEAMEDIEVLVMTRKKLHTAMKQDPEVAILLLEHLAKRLRTAFNQIERLSSPSIISRTAAALISLSVQSEGSGDMEVIQLPVSSKEYAAWAGLTPESFSRGIAKLADIGIIHKLKTNSFQILDHKRLLLKAKT